VDLKRFHPGHETADLRRAIGLHGHQKLILSVGRLSRRKGFDQVIAALPALIDSGIDVHYALVGIGEDREYLGHHAVTTQVAERVHFLGHVEPADLPRWYEAADVFAMPNRSVNSDTEGFGMVFIEAAACGTPSIAGRAGGTGSAVLDGRTGLRVDGEDLAAVVHALRRMLGDEPLNRRLGEAAAARARSEFSWDQVAAKTRALPVGNTRSQRAARVIGK
jgi:phosphatidyl-myo-inositol dimannoside synthase